VLVVGAGPAGLAGAVALSGSPLRTLLIDQGKPLDDRVTGAMEDLVAGQGGAGLYSDGKFSFFPSASALWRLEPRSTLHEAYQWVSRILSDSGLTVPAFSPFEVPYRSRAGVMTRKSYPSSYLSLPAREALIRDLSARNTGQVLFGTRLTDFSPAPTGSHITATVSTDSNGAQVETEVRARAMLLAGGRFGALTSGLTEQHLSFRRVEVGVRIQQPTDLFFLRDEADLDPKYIVRSSDLRYEWRTFCCCRDGKVVTTRFGDWLTLSGRADCPPTGMSNVGFNVRIVHEPTARAVWPGLIDAIRADPEPTVLPLDIYLDHPESMSSHYSMSNTVTSKLREGLSILSRRFGVTSLEQAEVHWPTVEGIGYYPAADTGLRVGTLPIWSAGDMTGRFRGVTAALVSGYFAGTGIEHHFGYG
jgi:uncharacterized protein